MESTPVTRYFLWGMLMALNGCASNVPVRTISLSASAGANASYATIIDLVVLFDKDLAAKVSSLSASQYFPAADQLEHDNQGLMLRWRWEVVPGQVIARCPIVFEKYNPLAAFVFARYYSPGDHRLQLTPTENVAILLEQEDFKVYTLVSGKPSNSGPVKGSVGPMPEISEDVFLQNAQEPDGDPLAKRLARRERIRQRLKAQQESEGMIPRDSQ
ncbi:MAG: hypothetical protein LBQ26_00560 [Holosporales bacterium]|nr:hypothetical protein [Holosporales bacterium]